MPAMDDINQPVDPSGAGGDPDVTFALLFLMRISR